jgi:hypothetical protein
MMNLTSPLTRSRWLIGADQWAAKRAQLFSVVYPNGPLTTGVDAVQLNYDYVAAGIALINECAHMSLYTINTPGGRGGGGTPQYQYLLYPHNPKGILMVWLCGHTGWLNYREDDEAFTVQRFLDEGWHVLVIPMPAFNYQTNPNPHQYVLTGGTWTNVGGTWSNVGGTLLDYYEHSYASLLDGGPSPNRMFADQFQRATNQAISEVNPTSLLLAGHSGGASSGNICAALDNRYQCWYSCCMGLPYNIFKVPSNAIDWESYLLNDIYTNAPTPYDLWGMLMIGSAVPGRRGAVVTDEADEYFPLDVNDVQTWLTDTQQIGMLIETAVASWTYRLELGGVAQHRMTTARLDWMINDINTNVL